jgi:hypothetical protein
VPYQVYEQTCPKAVLLVTPAVSPFLEQFDRPSSNRRRIAQLELPQNWLRTGQWAVTGVGTVRDCRVLPTLGSFPLVSSRWVRPSGWTGGERLEQRSGDALLEMLNSFAVTSG